MNTIKTGQRDNCGMKALSEFLEARIPFDGNQSLHCISSGVVGDETVRATAKVIGESILKSMEIKRQMRHGGLSRVSKS